MKTKTFSLLIISVLTLMFLVSSVSAAILAGWTFESQNLIPSTGAGVLTISDSRNSTFPSGNPPSPNYSMSTTGWDIADRYIDFDLSTTGYEDITLKLDYQASTQGPSEFKIQYSSDGTTFTDLAGSTTVIPSSFTTNPMSTFDFSSITSIDNNSNTRLRIVVPNSGIADSSAGTFRIDNVLIEGTAVSENPTEPSEIEACDLVGNPNNNLRIKDISINDKGFSSREFGDDNEWFPLDDIEVEIEIENNGNEKIENIEVQWGLYNVDTDEWVIELDDEKDFDLKEDKTETLTLTFKVEDALDVDLDELQDGDKYQFFVIANGRDTDVDEDVCEYDSADVEIIIESDFVVLDNVEFQEKVSCGSEIQLTANVWNIGDSDQDEISVWVYNEALNIDEKIEIGDINAFDSEPFNFIINVPEDAEEKTYDFKLSVLDENGDVYENDYNEDKSEFNIIFRVEGGCGAVQKALLTANLESGGAAGEEMVVKVTVTNTGSTTTETFSLSASGYSEWASSVDLDKEKVVLDKGESEDVLFTFNVNEDASGEQTFMIEVVSENQVVASQPVSVTIKGEGKAGFLTGGVINEGNWYLWGIGLLNVILIIIIIAVAARIARK